MCVSFCYRDLSHSCRSGPNFGHRYIVSYMYVNRVRDNNMFCYGHDEKGGKLNLHDIVK